MLDLVPSNTQLTVALLRNAETAGSPIPPPPPLPLKSAKGASVPPPLPARPLTTNGNEDEPPLAFPVAEEELTASDTASLASPTASRKSGKEKFASFVKTATKLTEEGAGYLGGERKLDWQKVSRVSGVGFVCSHAYASSF